MFKTESWTPCIWNKFFPLQIFNTFTLTGSYKFLVKLDKSVALNENGSASGVSKYVISVYRGTVVILCCLVLQFTPTTVCSVQCNWKSVHCSSFHKLAAVQLVGCLIYFSYIMPEVLLPLTEDCCLLRCDSM
jgi:hypothetical protein